MSRKWKLGWLGVFVAFTAVLAYLTLPTFSVATAESDRAPAPGFTLTDLGGNAASLDDYDQRVKVVNFWATWCHACKIEIPTLQAVHRAYKDRDVVVLGLSVDRDPADVVRFVEDAGIDYPMLVNAMETARTYHLRATPTTLILDRNNRVYKKYVGVQGYGTFERDIEALLRS